MSGDQVLRRLSEASGGRVLRASDNSAVAHAFTKIREELRSQYAIGYRPPDLTNGYRAAFR